MRRVFTFLAVVGLAIASSASFAVAAPAVTAAPRFGLSYVALQPARLFDSRPGTATVDTIGAGSGSVGPMSMATVRVLGRGGVPLSGVGSVVLSVTATGPSESTFLTVFPSGEARPVASMLNPDPALGSLASLTAVRPGADGSVSVFNDAGSTHVIVDVVGFFPAGVGFGPLSPARLLDTRSGSGTIDGVVSGQGPFGAETRVLPVAGRGGVPRSGVGSVLLNLTAVDATAPTFVTVWAAGGARPVVSSLNPIPGHTVSNLVVAPVGPDGTVRLANDTGTVHLLADVVGWLPVGRVFTPVAAERILDTRGGTPLAGGVVRNVKVAGLAGLAGVPTLGAGAVVVNVTVVNTSHATWVSVFPAGSPVPVASSLNPTPVTGVSAVASFVRLSAAGEIALFLADGTADVIVDVVGWFPDPTVVPLSGLGAGATHSCTTGGSGSVWCWGSNDAGQLGDPTLPAAGSNMPHQVPGIDDAIDVVTGSRFSCSLSLSGVVKCWGSNAAGQLGNRDLTFTNRTTPAVVAGIGVVTDVVAGFEHACVLNTAAEVWCWGYNSAGQLGTNDPAHASTPTPTKAAGLPAGVIAIGAGGEHSCASTVAGVWCWGSNGNGQLGNSDLTLISTDVPVRAVGVPGVKSFGLGRAHSCAVTTAAAVWCWGGNAAGQTGDTTLATSSATPAAVAGVPSAMSVAAGNAHSCAVTTSGGVWCWGSNGNGQLGSGTTGVGGPTPAEVAGATGVTAVSAGRAHSCALTDGLVALCWGRNDDGQVGNGTFLTVTNAKAVTA